MKGIILQNGISVTKVKPNSPIQLVASDVGFWTDHLNFRVVDTSGKILFNQEIGMRFQQGWADWQAPYELGWYYFLPDAEDYSNYVLFEVTPLAVIPTPPNGGGYVPPKPPDGGKDSSKPPPDSTPSWLIPIVAIAAGGIALLLLTTSGRKLTKKGIKTGWEKGKKELTKKGKGKINYEEYG